MVAVSDNLSTRGTQEVTDWLEQHPRWSFQFTPTHASWLNQIEIFFSILYRRLLKHGMFFSEEDLAEQMLSIHRDLQPNRQTIQVDLHRQGPPA